MNMCPEKLYLGLGRYSHYRYSIDTEINRYVSIRSSCCTDTDDGDSRKKTIIIESSANIFLHLTFILLSYKLEPIEFDLNYVEQILCE